VSGDCDHDVEIEERPDGTYMCARCLTVFLADPHAISCETCGAPYDGEEAECPMGCGDSAVVRHDGARFDIGTVGRW
jgi:hypothetical protein